MVYERYIKRAGKIHGPYYYESYREDGKVKKRYIGTSIENDYWKNNGVILLILTGFALLLFFTFLHFSSQITGRVSLDSSLRYRVGEILTGDLKLVLKTGELIPKESKIVISHGGESKEFVLSDFVDVETSAGNFFVEGVGELGNGEGYGVEGIRVIYPEVSFDFLVYNAREDQEGIERPVVNESVVSGLNESVRATGNISELNATQAVQNVSDANFTIAEKIEMAKEAVDVKITEEILEEQESFDVVADEEKVEETIDVNESTKGSKEKKKEAAKKATKTKTTKQMMQKKKEKKELKKEDEKKEATKASDKAKANAKKEVNDKIKRAVNEAVKKAREEAKARGKTLTQKQVDRIRKETRKRLAEEQAIGEEGIEAEEGGEESEERGEVIAENTSIINSTINQGITGGVIIEDIESYGNEHIVSGKISYNSSLIFILEEGQSAHVVPGSVRADGNETDELIVESEITDDFAVFSTEYVVFEEGFGKEFLSGEQLILRIDFSKFKIIARDENLEVSVVYQDKVLGEMKKNLSIIGRKGEQSEIQLKLLKEIEDIRILPSGNYTINLSEHFSGAERYEVFMQNITSALDEEILTLKVDEGFRGAREGRIRAYSGNESLESNKFKILISSGKLDVETIRKSERIVIGERVKWVKNISLEVAENITIELPEQAENVSVKKIEEGSEREAEAVVQKSVVSANAVKVEQKKFSFFTGFAVSGQEEEVVEVVIEDVATDYLIEYETPAPEAFEEETKEGKKVIISGPDDLNYTNVLAYTNISEVLKVGQEDVIRIKWSENGTNIGFEAYDLDGNEYLDYVEWNVPHLSNQTFEIILITDAVELDSNREFVRNVYEEVRERDGNWTGEIGAGRYVRVTFERNLTSSKDITIYARSNYTNSSVGVYEKDGTREIANFGLISEDKKYQIFLDGSSGAGLKGEQDTFDLLVEGNGIDFDFIIDPIPSVYTNVSSCGDLNVANTYYVLNVSVSAAGTCMNITANNVTLDGQGYLINYSQSSAGYGVKSEWYNGSVIRNLSIEQGGTSSSSYGIHFLGIVNGTIEHVNITTFGTSSVGIFMSLASYNNITSSTITTSGSSGQGIHMTTISPHNRIIEPIITTSKTNGYGIAIASGSFNTTVTNPIISTSGTSGLGIYISSSNNNTIINPTITTSGSSGYGIYISSSLNNNVTNGVVNATIAESLYLTSAGNTAGNVFTNVSLSETTLYHVNIASHLINGTEFIDMPYIGNYTIAGIGGTIIVRDSLFGELRFKQAVNGSGTNLTSDIVIGNNSVNISVGQIGLNRSANITLNSIGNRGFTDIGILKDRATCIECYNFTSLTADTVIFNTTGAGNYTIGDVALVTVCGTLRGANVLYTLQNDVSTTGTCFTITADNVTINLNRYNLTGDVNSATDYGVYINGANFSNVTNGYIRNFTIGVYVFEAFNNTITNLTISSSGNPGANGNVTGISLFSGNGNKIWYNNITSMNHTGGGKAIGIAVVRTSRVNYVENNSISYLNSSGATNSYAIYSTGNNNTYRGNKIYGAVDYGYNFDSSLRNVIEFGSVNNTRAYLINLSFSHNNTFREVELQSAGSGYNKVHITDSLLAEFVNMSFPSITFDDSSITSTAYKSWVVTVRNVTNSTNDVLSSVRIKVSDNESVMHRVEFTNGSGYLETFAPEAVNTSTGYRNLSTTVEARKSGYLRNYTYLNMSRNINVSFIMQRDNKASSISLLSVDVIKTGNKTFGFIVDDDSDLTSCTLYVNGVETQIKSSGLDSEGRNIIYQVIGSTGAYSWIIGCIDANGNQGNSSSADFAIAASSGGGGSSGTSTVPKVVAKCVSSYSCKDWGVCINGEQQRECVDIACFKGNIIEKRSCDSLCVTNWQCGEFGECVNGVTARACSDLNNCGVKIDKPSSSMSCSCTPEYQCGEWGGCTYSQGVSSILTGEVRATGARERICADAKGCAESYSETEACEVGSKISFSSSVVNNRNVLTAESESGEPVLSIDLDTLRNENKLNIIFLQSRPGLILCYNGIRDEGEEGIDCGGVCNQCRKERTNVFSLVREKIREISNNVFASKNLSYVLIGIYFVLLAGYIVYRSIKKKYSKDKK